MSEHDPRVCIQEMFEMHDKDAEKFFELSNTYSGHAHGREYDMLYRVSQGKSDTLRWVLRELEHCQEW